MTMTLERKAPDPVSFDLPFSASSASEARALLVSWLDAAGADDECRDDARLLISELVGNAVRHARPLEADVLRVEWTHEETALALSVTDGGSPGHQPQVVDAAVGDTGGRGLAIVESIAERWWVEHERHRTTVHCRLPLV